MSEQLLRNAGPTADKLKVPLCGLTQSLDGRAFLVLVGRFIMVGSTT